MTKSSMDIINAYSEYLERPKLQALKDFSRSSRKFNFRLMQGGACSCSAQYSP